MTEQPRLGLGHVLALAGAAMALIALWRPWYGVDVRAALGAAADGPAAGAVPGLGELARGLASMLPASIRVDGWRALEGADVALTIGSVGVAGLLIGASGALGDGVRIDPRAAAQGMVALGLLGVVLCVWHAVRLPGPGGVVHVESGLWLALAGSVLTTAGGVLGAMAPAPAASGAHGAAVLHLDFATPAPDPEHHPEPVRPPVAAGSSVAPPGM